MNFEQISQTREKFEDEQKIRAKERNKYRTLGQKLFLKDKFSGIDMAVEEAIKMDDEAKKLINSGEAATFADAIEILNGTEEFALKGKDLIKKEEYIRPKILQFSKYLDDNEFLKAFGASIIDSPRLRGDRDVLRLRNEALAPLINQKLSELIINKDGKNLVEAHHFFTIIKSKINREDIAEIPDNLLKSPEIINEVKKSLVSWMQNNPSSYAHWRDKWSALGIIDPDKMNNSPEIQKILKEKLDSLKKYDPKPYVYLKNKWEIEGLFVSNLK